VQARPAAVAACTACTDVRALTAGAGRHPGVATSGEAHTGQMAHEHRAQLGRRRKHAWPIAAAVLATIVAETAFMRRRGYAVGLKTVVRCRDGHMFTTIWIPGVSLKAVRLGIVRLQYCPVGRHITSVRL
jgi:hypothetical protein